MFLFLFKNIGLLLYISSFLESIETMELLFYNEIVKEIIVMDIEILLYSKSKELFLKELKDLTNEEVYIVLLSLVKDISNTKEIITGNRKVYYFSCEFLIGKLLSNNLINLGIYQEVNEILDKQGFLLSQIEEVENEPSLGNGGLGRLAACFLDSLATLDLAGDGIGLNYHLGLFKQAFKEYKQCELPNEWIGNYSWLNSTEKSFVVEYKDFCLKSRLYDMDVIGYHGNINKLHLFDIGSVDEHIVKEGISFDKTHLLKNLTLFLYPDDSDEDGKILRLYQQYFMVSNGAQLIIQELLEKGYDLSTLDQHVVIQINDTHPSLVIPELIRLLTKEGIERQEAIRIVSNTCAYTNHTILAEALEKWPMHYLEEAIPQLIPIIKELDALVKIKTDNPKVQIIDKQNLVHMAHMDIHYGFSINGVAAIHTEILKQTELKDFYEMYPNRFNNKTNGITFRRWLLSCNKELTNFIDSLIGEGYKTNALELEKLLNYQDNLEVLETLLAIKMNNKQALANYIQLHESIRIDPNSIYDIQIKRLHEYKRQQMNVLYIIHQYLEIKKGNYPAHPITCIFGAKAAPAYIIAKDIIHTILCLQELIDRDEQVSSYLKVVMVENYNVTYAEKLIPACDISEQISLASKEASGTGNMKFMLNGAITLGTDDGANVEIHELVGDQNIYIFGHNSDSVIEHYQNNSYHPSMILTQNPKIQELVDFIISESMLSIGDETSLQRLYQELTNKDWFMTLLDLEEYIAMKQQVISDYHNNRINWARMMLVNIAKAGYFSSDRTIGDYNNEIWKLK